MIWYDWDAESKYYLSYISTANETKFKHIFYFLDNNIYF